METGTLRSTQDYADGKLSILLSRLRAEKAEYSLLPDTDYNIGYEACLRRTIGAVMQLTDHPEDVK